MSKKCECCGRISESKQCYYCGFVSVVALDKEGEAFNRQRVKEHKQQMIDSLEKISIVAYAYRADANGRQMEQVEKRLLPVCSGKECYDKVVWAPYNFGHQETNSPMDVIDIKLVLSFKSGDAREVECGAKAPAMNDFWKLGVRLSKTLDLEVLFGAADSFVLVDNELMWPKEY